MWFTLTGGGTLLSEEVIASTGDRWITEMKNDELLDMFKLSL